jgi:hypothetical protein
LIDGAIVTDIRRLTDHNTEAMIDKNATTYGRTGVNLNTG